MPQAMILSADDHLPQVRGVVAEIRPRDVGGDVVVEVGDVAAALQGRADALQLGIDRGGPNGERAPADGITHKPWNGGRL